MDFAMENCICCRIYQFLYCQSSFLFNFVQIKLCLRLKHNNQILLSATWGRMAKEKQSPYTEYLFGINGCWMR